MSLATETAEDTGLEVIDLDSDPAFARRSLHTRSMAVQMEGMRRLAHAFVERPATILQELVNAAVSLCEADSAGISIEQDDATETSFYQWIATAGEYAGFLNAALPRYPSACGVCIERGRPQLFRVSQPFFDKMGIEAALVTDGLLLPWQVEGTRGTIWIMAHGRTEAFDREDCRMMRVLADFAAMGVRQQRQQAALLAQTKAAAAAATANELAHKINNPLQSLTNIVYLAAEGESVGGAQALARELSEHVERLSVLVGRLLALSVDAGTAAGKAS